MEESRCDKVPSHTANLKQLQEELNHIASRIKRTAPDERHGGRKKEVQALQVNRRR